MFYSIANFLYAPILNLRNYLYDFGYLSSHEFDFPIVGVGNVNFGGTGKSEVVLSLSRFFRQQGYFPIILAKGYKGRVEEPTICTEGIDEIGDEPLMYRFLGETVVISHSKYAGAQLISERYKRDDLVVILDDHLQHRRIRPSVSLVTIDTARTAEFESAFLPYFREPWKRVLGSSPSGSTKPYVRRVDGVVLVTRSGVDDNINIEKYVQDIPIAKLRYKFKGFKHIYNLSGRAKGDLQFREIPLDEEVFLISGIASPESFHNMVKRETCHLKLRVLSFRDHHNYRLIDLPAKGKIITTLKDGVKIAQLMSDSDLEKSEIYYAAVEGEFLTDVREIFKGSMAFKDS